MAWILFGIVTLLMLSIFWFITGYRRDLRKDQEVFDEYLENQRKMKFSKRDRGRPHSKKDGQLFN